MQLPIKYLAMILGWLNDYETIFVVRSPSVAIVPHYPWGATNNSHDLYPSGFTEANHCFISFLLIQFLTNAVSSLFLIKSSSMNVNIHDSL